MLCIGDFRTKQHEFGKHYAPNLAILANFAFTNDLDLYLYIVLALTFQLFNYEKWWPVEKKPYRWTKQKYSSDYLSQGHNI